MEKKEDVNTTKIVEREETASINLEENKENVFFFSKKYFFLKFIYFFLINLVLIYIWEYYIEEKRKSSKTRFSEFLLIISFSFLFFYLLTSIFDFIYYINVKVKTFKNYVSWRFIHFLFVYFIFRLYCSLNYPEDPPDELNKTSFLIMFFFLLDTFLTDLICYWFHLRNEKTNSEIIEIKK